MMICPAAAVPATAAAVEAAALWGRLVRPPSPFSLPQSQAAAARQPPPTFPAALPPPPPNSSDVAMAGGDLSRAFLFTLVGKYSLLVCLSAASLSSKPAFAWGLFGLAEDRKSAAICLGLLTCQPFLSTAEGTGGLPLAIKPHDCSLPHDDPMDVCPVRGESSSPDGQRPGCAAHIEQLCNGDHPAANGLVNGDVGGHSNGHANGCLSIGHPSEAAAAGGDEGGHEQKPRGAKGIARVLTEGRTESVGLPETPSLGGELRGGFSLPQRLSSLQAQVR
jgi:hypothetical protein